MYENLNYEQLKGMQDEQKKEVLTKLMSMYNNDVKLVANKMNAPFIAVSNMVKRIIEGKPVGRTKNVISLPETTQEIKPKRKYIRKNNDQEVKQDEAKLEIKQESQVESVVPTHKGIKATNIIEGIIPGNELIKRLEGLSKAILDNKEYEIVVKITEI